MSTWIDLTKIEELKEIADGDQIHINHEGCPAGTDRKRRLYIKRDGITFLAYCHHCSGSGVLTMGGLSGRKTIRRNNKDENSSGIPITLPADYEELKPGKHSQAVQWVAKYGVPTHQFGWSERLKRIIIPVFEKGELIGYQARAMNGEKPKYRTYGTLENVLHRYSGNSCVIVEDYISQCRLGRFAISSLCLFGTNLSKLGFCKLINNHFEEVFIWLDDDNRHVKKQQLRLFFELGKFFDARIIKGQKQPKECSKEEIVATLGIS
jgi:hypothetical protein